MARVRERISVLAFAAALLFLFVALAVAAGYAVGKLLL
jgi:hypothetical protein